MNPSAPRMLLFVASVVAVVASCGLETEAPPDDGTRASAVTSSSLTWKGRSWTVTSGGMAGVAPGSLANVSVDANGYLHLRITKSGASWTAAELFSNDRLGFGTYQWQVDAPIDRFDRNVVLGLFPYGPAAGIGQDGTNEIDIEYSRWGNASAPNGDWTDYPASGSTVGELTYTFSLNGGTTSTSRFVWNKSSIISSLYAGFTPVGSTTGLIKSWTYAPSSPSTNIPQQALPLGMNLWCFGAPPSDGQNVEVVIRDFQFVPEGTGGGGSGGGGSGGGGSAGGAGAGGAGGGGGGGSLDSVKIDCGGPGVQPFSADAYFSGGKNLNHANVIDLGGVTNPAPVAVYQTGRLGTATYTIPGFAVGSNHTVRLHFAETYFSNVGSRVFHVAINGAPVLTSFDIVKAAGAKNKANVQAFTRAANGSGAYVIQFTSAVDQSLVAGIEIQ